MIVYKKKVHTQSLFIFLCCSLIKMLVAGKRKYNHKQYMKNVKPLKDLEKGMSNRDVAAKYGVPRNTLSIWVKNKEKILDSLEKGTNVKWQKLGTSNFELVDEGICNWFQVYAKSKCSIISCHDSREDTYIRQKIKCWKLPSIRWLVTTLQWKKPHKFQRCFRVIKICYTRNSWWWVMGNVSSNSFVKLFFWA